MFLLWGQRVFLGVPSAGRIDPQLPITGELPGSNQKSSMSLGRWLKTPEDGGEGLHRSDPHLRTPATIHPHPIGLLPIDEPIAPSISRNDLDPSIDPGVVDMDHLNGLLEFDDLAAWGVEYRVARAVGERVGEEEGSQHMNSPDISKII